MLSTYAHLFDMLFGSQLTIPLETDWLLLLTFPKRTGNSKQKHRRRPFHLYVLLTTRPALQAYRGSQTIVMLAVLVPAGEEKDIVYQYLS